MFIFTGYIKLNCIVESLIITIQALLDMQSKNMIKNSYASLLYLPTYLLHLKGKFEIS